MNNLQFLSQFETDGNVNNLDMLNIFGKGYTNYYMFIDLINASANGGYMGLRFYDNSGTLIDGNEYQYGGEQLSAYGSYDNTWRSTGTSQIAPILVGSNDDSRGGGALIKIFNADVAQFTFVTVQSASFMDSGLDGSRLSGCHETAEIVSGVRIVNHTTKTFKVTIYGVE
tara:strand:- start:598 stop:1107 length:510 start_codon:yes stop_codon:yes gene_type:complete